MGTDKRKGYAFLGGRGGTGGTLTGVGTFLKEKNPRVRIISIQAQRNHLIQGLRKYGVLNPITLQKKRK